MATAAQSSNNPLIKEIQLIFPKLYSSEAKIRLSTASQLLEIISKDKEQPLDDVFYSVVERLIRGTTAPKDYPKIGSTVLLTEILHSFSNFRISKLLEMCKKIIGDVNDELKVDGVTGWTLIFTSIIQSNRLDISDKKTLKELIRFMVQLGIKKPLSNIAICNIFEMLFDRQFDPEAFSSILKSSLKLNEHGDASPFHLYLILLIHKHPELSRVLDHIPTVDLDDPDNLIQYIEATIPYHPSIHPACVELFRHIDENNRMEAFWKPVFNDPLFASEQSHKNHRYGLSFISSILPFLNESNASYVFSKQMMDLWMQGLTNRQSRLHSVAMQLSKDLVANYDTYDGALQSTIILLLTESPGTVSFDDITQTKTVSQLYFKTKPEAGEFLVNGIIEKIRNYKAASARDKMRSLFVGQLRDLVKSIYVTGSSDLKLTVLNFFLAHGYFDVSNVDTLNLVTPATDSLVLKIQSQFFKLIGSFCSTNPDVMEGVGLHALQLIKEEVPLKDEKTAPLWKKMKKMKIKFKKLKASGEHEKQLSIFKPLLYGIALSSLQDSSEIETLIANFDELVECFKRALGEGPEENEPKWADVLLDLMISQFPVQSPFLSSVMIKAFRLVVSDVTLEGLEQLKIALLVDKLDEDQDGDDEEEGDAGDEVENEKEGESADKLDEESEGEESDMPEDEDEDVDDEFRAKVTLALGPAAAVGDETDTPIDDDEMFQLDEALSEAFRSKYSTDKHTQATLKILRSKCLDLIEIIFKSKEQSLERVLFLVPVLIDAIKLYGSSKEVELRARVSKLFMLLPNCKLFSSYDAFNAKVAQTLFKKGIDMASKMDNTYIQASAAKICVWIMSLSKHTDLNTDWVFDHLLKLLQEYFSKPNSFVSKEFFMIIFQNHKIFNSQILEALSKSVFVNLRPFKKLGGLALINAYLRLCQNDIVADKAIEACLHSIKRDTLIGLESAVSAKRSALTIEYRRLLGTLNKFIPSEEKVEESPKKGIQLKNSKKEKKMKKQKEEEKENVEMETEATKEENKEKEIDGETTTKEEKMETEENDEKDLEEKDEDEEDDEGQGEAEDKEMEDEKEELKDNSKSEKFAIDDNDEMEVNDENEEKFEMKDKEEKLEETEEKEKEGDEELNTENAEEEEDEHEKRHEAEGVVEENENEDKVEEKSENDSDKNEELENGNDNQIVKEREEKEGEKEEETEEEEKEKEKDEGKVNGEATQKEEPIEENEKTEKEDDKEDSKENEVKKSNDLRSPRRSSIQSVHSNPSSPLKKSRKSIDKTPTSPKPSTSFAGLSSGKKSKSRTPKTPSSMLDEHVNKLESLHIDQKEEEPVVKRIKFESPSDSGEDSPPTIRLTRARVKTPRVVKTSIKPEPETAEEQLEAGDDLTDFSVPRVQIIKTPTTRSRARSATPTKETPNTSATTPLRRSLRTRK